MPVAFHDTRPTDELGSAGFLKLEPLAAGAGARAGLLVINPRGEPLEFVYNRISLPQPFLWNDQVARRYLERRLASSLLSVCSHDPRLLVCLASEVEPAIFGAELRLEVPVVRLSPRPAAAAERGVDRQTGEVIEHTGDVIEPPAEAPELSWQPAPPADGSAELQLFEHLRAHGLLLEPLERAALGLAEVYAPSTSLSPRP